jgi:hypothetical protein
MWGLRVTGWRWWGWSNCGWGSRGICVLRVSTLSFVRNPQIICATSSTATMTSPTLISASTSSSSRGIRTVVGRIMTLLVASITSHFFIVRIRGRSFIASGFFWFLGSAVFCCSCSWHLRVAISGQTPRSSGSSVFPHHRQHRKLAAK